MSELRKITSHYRNFPKLTPQICMDCNHDCLYNTGYSNYFMLKREIWELVNPLIRGFLCISCTEKRLGRKLTKSDFADIKLTYEADSYWWLCSK